jgi:predicted nucleotide-binding protein (sugar kinase/HSP70/actin superfamily)
MSQNGHNRKKKVGIPNSFTCFYQSVRVIERFLKNAGVEVVKTPRTTPDILKAGATLCSADFCIPVRVQVGHVYTLAVEHPDLDFILIPNLCREHHGVNNCSKYRDISGIAIRSIAGTVGYIASQADEKEREKLATLLGEEEVALAVKNASVLPKLLQPEIWSIQRDELFNVCYSLYCDIQGLPKQITRIEPFVPGAFKPKFAPHYVHCRRAFDKAYETMVEKQPNMMNVLLKDETKPRLAIVGRNYLHEDTLVTADLKPFFKEKGCEVITAHDVPFPLLEEGFNKVVGFYETHRLYQSFVDLIADKVDGAIVIGSFGCHPDAFENEYFLDYVRAKGLPAWLFKYDEQSGSAGFKTRYETILGFLEQRRDYRLAKKRAAQTGEPLTMPEPVIPLEAAAHKVIEQKSVGGFVPLDSITVSNKSQGVNESTSQLTNLPMDQLTITKESIHKSLYKTGTVMPMPHDGVPRKPLLLWPHMSPILDCLVEEVFYQAGLSSIALKPDIVSEVAIELGNYKYTESCCPYALSTGSLMEAIRKAFRFLEEDAKRRGLDKPEPRRILLLQGRGEGPCTYGWYAQLQQIEMPKMFADELIAGNHTMEMATVGLSGVADFMRELSQMGDAQKLKPILDMIDAAAQPGGLQALPWWKQQRLKMNLWKAIHPFKGTLTATAWAKVVALEEIRAKTLIVRAHEYNRGETTAVWREACQAMSAVHTLPEIEEVKRKYLRKLDEIEQDHDIKPRVLAVGEIYVALASFANRGTIDNLLGREGIEIVEGITLGHFIRTSLGEMKRRALTGKIKPLLEYLKQNNVYLWDKQDRGTYAKPFALHEVGGDGVRSVSDARHAIEHLGVDGIVHIYPFKCMPEMIAKTALAEVAKFYGVRYLPLNFDKETEIERLRTEVSTFAAMLKIQAEKNGAHDPALYRQRKEAEKKRRQQLGRTLEGIWRKQRARRYVD